MRLFRGYQLHHHHRITQAKKSLKTSSSIDYHPLIINVYVKNLSPPLSSSFYDNCRMVKTLGNMRDNLFWDSSGTSKTFTVKPRTFYHREQQLVDVFKSKSKLKFSFHIRRKSSSPYDIMTARPIEL